MAVSQNKNIDTSNLIVEDINQTVTEEDIPPPPSNWITKFKTMEEWLQDICKNDKPKKSISQYQVSLFESPEDYILALVGMNTQVENKNSIITRIEFEPLNMYFNLPKPFFKGLDRKQLLEKLTVQLKNFVKTEAFRNSFFTKANKIVFETNGEMIWSK